MGRSGVCHQCPRRSTAREKSFTSSALFALTLRGKSFFDRARRFHSRQRHFKCLWFCFAMAQPGVSKDELMKEVWPDTFVEEANLSRTIFMLRKALGETPKDHRYIVTVPGHGYRLAADVLAIPEQELDLVSVSRSTVQVQVEQGRSWGWMSAMVLLVLAVAFGVFRLTRQSPSVFTEKDTVVLADFANSTGDPAFEESVATGHGCAIGTVALPQPHFRRSDPADAAIDGPAPRHAA